VFGGRGGGKLLDTEAVQRLRMSRAIYPMLHLPSLLEQGHLFISEDE